MTTAHNTLQWHRFEENLVHPNPPADPFRDTELNVTWTGPQPDAIETLGFYDGNNTWRFRFMPSQPGIWSYKAAFSDTSAETTGSFTTVASDLPGMVSIDPANPLWFGHTSGHPGLVRALHVGDRFFAENWSTTSRQEFLNWFQDQGYNTLSVASHYLNRQGDDRGTPWDTPGLWPLNPAAYRTLESTLDELARRRIIVYPFAGFFGQSSNYPKAPQDQELYIRYTIARLGSYWNLLFNTAGPEPNLKNAWMENEEVERLTRCIAANDPYQHPLSVHNRSGGDDPFRDTDYTTYSTVQGPKTIDQQKLNTTLRNTHHPQKPLLAQETLWAGNVYHMRSAGRDYTLDDLRKNAIVMHMAAAAIVFADNAGKSSTGFSGTMDPADCRQERHDVLRQVWDFFETMPYYQMSPRQDLVDSGYCLADDRADRILVYLPENAPVNISIANGPYKAEWINGRNTLERQQAAPSADGKNLQAPADQDWFLYLTRTGDTIPDQLHLSWSDNPATSLAVTWHTAEKTTANTIHYRPTGTNTWHQSSSVTFPSPGDGHLHRASLTDLTPATSYQYRIDDGPVHRTKTAPANGAADFTFAFLADTGLIGRTDGNTTGTRQVIHEILKDQPLFILGGGDYAYANADDRFTKLSDAIDAWFIQSESLLSRFPFMAQYGNHEIELKERYQDWAPRFAHPEGHDENRNYSFDIADVHFTAFFAPTKDLNEDHLAWLDKDLAQARNNGTGWLIVFQHESIYGHGSSHPARPHLRAALAPIFEKHRVDLHLSCHDQNYERTFPLNNVPDNPTPASIDLHHYQARSGVIYAKISPGGKMSEIGNQFSQFTTDQQPFMAVRDCTAHHYGLIHLKASGTIHFEAFNIIGDGTPKTKLDDFTITI